MSFRSSLALAVVAVLAPAVTAQEGPRPGQSFVQTGERAFSRVLFFDRKDGEFHIPCQIVLTYGAPEWKEEFEGMIAQVKEGRRVRLGKDSWPTLDTNRPLTMGGAKVAPGSYYLTVEAVDDKTWNLVLLDPNDIRKELLDAFQAEKTKGGIAIPMKWQRTEKEQEKLLMTLSGTKDKPRDFTLLLRWGKHELSAPVTIQM